MAMGADNRSRSDADAGIEARVISNDGSLVDDDIGADLHVSADFGSRVDDRGRVDLCKTRGVVG